MIRDIITYPTPPSALYSTDVRFFDENLFSLLQDLKDTITKNNLEALAAYQIGNQFNVIVIKEKDGTFLELINPRVFNPQGSIESEETTAYFPGLSAKIKRHQSISVIYQDRNGKDCSLKAVDERAILLQRKIDYTFGSTFMNKLDKNEKKLFEKKLEFGSNIATPESCPIISYKDYINKFIKVCIIGMLVVLGYSFFSTNQQLFDYETLLLFIIFLNSILYLIVGYFEGKRYSSCTSCQIGNLIGTVVINWIKTIGIYGISYFIL